MNYLLFQRVKKVPDAIFAENLRVITTKMLMNSFDGSPFAMSSSFLVNSKPANSKKEYVEYLDSRRPIDKDAEYESIEIKNTEKFRAPNDSTPTPNTITIKTNDGIEEIFLFFTKDGLIEIIQHRLSDDE